MLRRPPGSTRTTHSFPTRRSSDLANLHAQAAIDAIAHTRFFMVNTARTPAPRLAAYIVISNDEGIVVDHHALEARIRTHIFADGRSEENTSELQPLMRISYAVLCLIKKISTNQLSNSYIYHKLQDQLY